MVLKEEIIRRERIIEALINYLADLERERHIPIQINYHESDERYKGIIQDRLLLVKERSCSSVIN